MSDNPTAREYRELLLRFIGSLTLCDHMGDVANDVETALREMGVDVEWDDWNDLRRALHAMGVTTLYGTELV